MTVVESVLSVGSANSMIFCSVLENVRFSFARKKSGLGWTIENPGTNSSLAPTQMKQATLVGTCGHLW